MPDSREFEFEGGASPSEAADALARLAEGIRARGLSLSSGAERITIHPGPDLSLEVEAIAKKGRARIEIAIAWRQPRNGGP